jgi:hypothetical protein
MMASHRLWAVSPALVEWGVTLSPDERKLIALHVAEWACNQTGAIVSIDGKLMMQIKENSCMLDKVAKKELEEKIMSFDDMYFDIVEKSDGELDGCGLAINFFLKARSIAALLYSLDGEILNNFYDSLYEANAAISNDIEKLISECNLNLS